MTFRIQSYLYGLQENRPASHFLFLGRGSISIPSSQNSWGLETLCCSRFDDPTHESQAIGTLFGHVSWFQPKSAVLTGWLRTGFLGWIDILQYIGWYNPKLIINQQGCLARKTIHLSMGTSLQNFSHHFFNTSRGLESDK